MKQEEKRDKDSDEDSKRKKPYKTTGLDDDERPAQDAADSSPLPNVLSSPNNLKKTPGGNTSLCSTSTTATIPATPMTSIVTTTPYGRTLVKPINQESSTTTTTLTKQRRLLTRDALVMFLLSAVSFAFFLYFYLPLTALVALGMFVMTNCLGFYFLYERVIVEYNNILHGRGLGDYLPRSLYVQLAETSLHEWMMDSSFFNEYRHLMLYYMPGITTEQLEELINRLPPRRHELLHRRGLGHVFGEDFMRLLMGDSRYQPPPSNAPMLMEPQQSTTDRAAVAPVVAARSAPLGPDEDANEQAENSPPPIPSITARALPRRLYEEGSEDGASDMGLDSPAESPEPSAPEEEAQQQPDLTSDWWEEGQIITDAFMSMAQSYSRSTLSYGRQTLQSVGATAADYLSTALIVAGVGTTSIATGVGLVGVWYGAYYPWRGTQSSSSRFPGGRILLSSAFAGGISAGVMLLVRGALRSRRALPPPDTAGSPEENKKKDE